MLTNAALVCARSQSVGALPQGYPSELLPVSVSLIPSMHICLDFIPELLSQPHLEKQVRGPYKIPGRQIRMPDLNPGLSNVKSL